MREFAGDSGDEAVDEENERDAYLALDALMARAKTQPDPVRWTRSHVRAALDRLERVDEPHVVKDEARRQLLAIERRMLTMLLTASASGSAAVAFVYVVTLGVPLA